MGGRWLSWHSYSQSFLLSFFSEDYKLGFSKLEYFCHCLSVLCCPYINDTVFGSFLLCIVLRYLLAAFFLLKYFIIKFSNLVERVV